MPARISSSPVRIAGHKHLTPLPVEVYILILEAVLDDGEDRSTVEHRSVLRNLNLVCRLFANWVTPKLFARLTFAGSPPSKQLKRGASGRTIWMRQLASGERSAVALAAMVRELELSGSRPVGDGHHATSESTSWRHAQIIPRFPNLSSLTLAQTVIPQEFFITIKSLDNLRNLSIKYCSFAPPGRSYKPPPSSLKLEYFEAVLLTGAQPFVPALSSLAGGSAIRTLKTTEWCLARAIMEKSPGSNLEHLEVHFDPRQTTTLLRFLESTPMISELSLVSVLDSEGSPAPPSRPSGVALPCLKTLRCPLNLLAALLRGGEVSRLSVVDMCDWLGPSPRIDDRLLMPLQQSALRELEIPAWMFYQFPIHQYVPRDLAHLSICFDLLTSSTPLERVVRDICALDRTPTLRGLDLRFVNAIWRLNLSLQHRMITQHLARACPTAIRFSFDEGIDWERDTSSSKWKPVILMRESVKALLKTKPDIRKLMQVVDFDGALAGLFDDGEMTPAVAACLS